ncbi:hypothetical protein F5X96DRAFT_160583 [Biscogniauxia mediterranea]|nr:hypothetical protein F5X96DRAFT_160583 [Biscogniauxia mediterranea]
MSLLFTVRALIHASIWALWLGSVAAGSIASWDTGGDSPQVIMQDDATGSIRYSLCNSGEVAVFPGTDSEAFVFDDGLSPKSNTSLTGVGWVADDGARAVMWHLTEANQIVNSIWRCDETGHFVPASTPNQWIVSTSAPSINANTGLTALNLGEDAGYRVYFHDENMAIRYLRYTTADNWSTGSFVTQDQVQGTPIAGGFPDTSLITIVAPRDESNIEVSTFGSNGTWLVTSFPTPFETVTVSSNETDSPVTNATNSSSIILDHSSRVDRSLEAWDGNARGIGLTINNDASRNIFYIGNDSLLHQVNEVNDTWQASTQQDSSIWPQADEPNAQFATAFDFSRNELWVYYMSGGNLTQVHRNTGNSWDVASRLPTEPPATESGLSTGAKAGIGVGVGVAGLALIGIAAFFLLRRRKGQNEKEKVEAEAEAVATIGNQQHPSSYPSPAPAYTSGVTEGQWIDGRFYPNQTQNKPEERWQSPQPYQPSPDPQAVYEMPNQEYTHEMGSQVDYHEMPGNSDNQGTIGRTEGRT